MPPFSIPSPDASIGSIGHGRFRRAAILMLVMMAMTLVALPVLASTAPHLRIAHNEIGRTQYVQIGVNKSVIIDLPAEAGEVIISQPSVANAIMRTKTRAVIQGMSAGETNIFFLDPSGGGIAVIEISVAQDATGLASVINRLLPGSRIQVQSFADSVILSGDVQSGDDLEKAVAIASQYVGSSNVTSVVNVAGGQQVALKVTVAEIKRDTAQQLGINLSGTLTMGALNLGVNSSQSGLSNGYSGNFSQGAFAIEAALRAMETRNAVRMLAEPVLTAISGETADFHVGGELPILVTNAEGNQQTIFKPYGIRLNFTPTVRSNGVIGLQVSTEVSEPQLNNTLNTRRASTSVELQAYQTLAIAGLIDERLRRQVAQLPGLGNIPILGALFRSHEYVSEQTELVILVTPMIAQAHNTPPPLPTDRSVPATNAEAIFLGRMENLYGVTGADYGGQFRGSVGFVLD